jgi:hypothetical protein
MHHANCTSLLIGAWHCTLPVQLPPDHTVPLTVHRIVAVANICKQVARRIQVLSSVQEVREPLAETCAASFLRLVTMHSIIY